MTTHLVIVESPAKAKTIKKYLGKDYEVLASYGHVRDLLPKEGAVDPAHDFAMKYQVIDRNSKHVDAIAKALKKADSLLLATDPDREGEAISWHLLEILKAKKLLKDKPVGRVYFTRSPNAQSVRRLKAHVNWRWIWLMPSRPVVRWIIWWVSTSRRCYGKRSVAVSPLVGCRVLRCA
jgi:DNA topoisomerase-1